MPTSMQDDVLMLNISGGGGGKGVIRNNHRFKQNKYSTAWYAFEPSLVYVGQLVCMIHFRIHIYLPQQEISRHRL